MKITQHNITIKSLSDGYENKYEDGVFGLSGNLDIRPAYQREFVYKDDQRDAVISTVLKGFPLNVMYWVKNDNSNFEILDGQQRTISICEYVAGNFSIKDEKNDPMFFTNLPKNKQNKLLEYELFVYICEGEDSEKLDWFTTINIAGEKLTPQELRNATYTGTWLTAAKSHFSRKNCPAQNLGKKYITGSPERQDYLEIAIDWISSGKIKEYMSDHQNDQNANELWLYFKAVIDWVESIFGKNYRKEMKGVSWGFFYNHHKNDKFNTDEIEKVVSSLMRDDDVTNKSGIYRYVFTKDQRHLSIRSFTDSQKRSAYENQSGKCHFCEKEGSNKTFYKIEEMEADHITPWSKGGKTIIENCQMLCKMHNRIKSSL